MKRKYLAGAAAAMVLVPAGIAFATPGSGVTAEILGRGNAPGGIEVSGDGPTDVVVRHITIQPGGTTGWHYHPGQLIALVKAGTLTRVMDDCMTETTAAGSAFVEEAGDDHVHMGRNDGTTPVELYVTYVLPAGSPLSVDAPNPGC